MRHGLARSAVFALACAGIYPTPTWAQAPTPTRGATAPPANALQRNVIPADQDLSELKSHLAEDLSELKPSIDDGPSPKEIQVGEIPQEISPCAPSSPLLDSQVLGAVTVVGLTLNGDLHIASHDQDRLASSIKHQRYFGNPDEVTAAIMEVVKAVWLDRGYFKAQVDGEMKVLTNNAVSMRIALAVHVDEGQTYRLGQITFNGNREVANTKALRNLFHLREGDSFSRAAVAEGLENLRKAYLELGFLNFTSIPNTQIDERTQTISLAIDMNEGQQFFISSINIAGLDGQASENVLKDSLLKPGDIYNQRLAEFFVRQHGSLLSPDVSPASRVGLHYNEPARTVAVSFDFRRCAVN